MRVGWVLSLFLVTHSSWANLYQAWSTLRKDSSNIHIYPQVAERLIKSNLYYTAVPYIKEYLVRIRGRGSQKVDQSIDKTALYVGIRQFEVLPVGVLMRSSSPIMRYIAAKKHFRIGKYNKALRILEGAVPHRHPLGPFALFLRASILSIRKKYKAAINSYQNCVSWTKWRMNREKDKRRLRQLAINRDYCLVGVARTQFAAGQYEKANLSYLDLPKESFIWPEILFEEAWNSFYEKDYNRTLGKLVTYKAPIIKAIIFNPEIEILKALTYMELCLWGDARQVVDNFYHNYKNDALRMRSFLKKHGRNYKHYYLLAKAYGKGERFRHLFLNKLLKAITKDPSYREIKSSFDRGKEEIKILKSLRKGPMKSSFIASLREALVLQRDLIGAYVRKGLQLYVSQVENSFKGMSYIKLEILGRKKFQIYNPKKTAKKRVRGDIKYLKRNEKQYFWSFNGEFWADELGDYVFSLKPECT